MSDDHPFSELPVSQRIDATLAVLSNMEYQSAEGYTVADLADLCGCSRAAILARQQSALKKLKKKHPALIREIQSNR